MKKSPQAQIHISAKRQRLTLKSGRKTLAAYLVSTSRFGLGTEEGSMKTPTGRFRISEKIGDGMPNRVQEPPARKGDEKLSGATRTGHDPHPLATRPRP
jgi:hypothetical protein